MRRTVSLFEFMPYGAPELIAARRPHLAAALTTSSAIAALMFAAALLVSPLLRVPVVPVVHDHFIDPWPDSPAQPNINPPPPPIVPAKPHAQYDDGIVIPVPPSDAPIVENPPNGGTSADPSGGLERGEPDSGAPGISHDVLPKFGDYVHVDELPVPINEFKPEYPEFARQVNAEGYVVVHALVGKDGHVLQVKLDEKFRNPLFNDASVEGAKRWVFKPAYSDGHPVPVWFAIPFHYVLRE